MKIIDKISKLNRPCFSFEFFPPKTVEGDLKLFKVIGDLQNLMPDFVSVTYGAGGSTREKTFSICEKIQNDFNILTMSHYTCVNSSSDEIEDNLNKLSKMGIQNIIALRGDPPKGSGKFKKHEKGFLNATELVQFIKTKGYKFGIAGGCYPEKHPDSPTLEQDIENLKKKVDSGAEFLLTQLFFENSKFYDFMDLVFKKGIKVPVIPGIMPITSFSQIERFKELADCSIPDDLIMNLEKVKDHPDDFKKISLDFTVNQCKDLLKNNAFGIHLYTLNQSNATFEILKLIK